MNMMNKRIRSMIDEIFSEMKMTADNLALRDELMANAQARYEDVIAQGKAEEEAFAEVAASLGDVNALLHEMNGQDMAQDMDQDMVQEAPAAQGEAPAQGEDPEREEAAEEAPAQEQEKPADTRTEIDLGDALNKAFTALGDFGKSLMPQARKLVSQMDDVTGGAIRSVGKAVGKGMKDAQKAAGEAIDKMSDMSGELVFDFGRREEPAGPAGKTPDELREEAKDIRAQAEFKRVTGDQEGADELNAQAEALETQADALEQAQAMADAQKAAAEAAAGETAEEEPDAQSAPDEECIVLEASHTPVLDEDGDVNEDAFTRVVEQIERETETITGGEEDSAAQDAAYTVRDAHKPGAGRYVFPAAGLRAVDIELDADDVRIETVPGAMVEVVWTARNVDGEPDVRLEGHKLIVRRKNPDVFKTFFSVFSKQGGQLTVRVPYGYAPDYRVCTTSGDIHLYEVDSDNVKANSTSGSIRLEPDATVRADLIKAETVSGSVTVSACANDVRVTTVSGSQFISCDAETAEADTVSGKVHIEGACAKWNVNAVSGEVELICTVVPTQKIDIDTMSASARVALPGSIRGFAAKLNGMSGKIVNEFGVDRYGTCALPIQMDSMSGSLIITRL